MYILGVSAFYHDSAAALIKDGEIVAAAQEERFTRKKLDSSLPVNAIGCCLRQAGIEAADLDAVVYYDDPLLTLHRFISNVSAVGDDSADLIGFGSKPLFGQKLWVEKLLRDCLGKLGREDRLYVTLHHMSHAASAFYPSPFRDAAILTIDGVGEWNTTVIGEGHSEDIRLLKKIDYPHSLGLLYSAFTYFCGFRVNFGDYKLMGLAPYGEPVYKDLILDKLIDLKDDGSFRLDLAYFDFQHGRAMTNKAFEELFGGPRRLPEDNITRREMDMAASVQAVTQDAVLRLARTAKKLTGADFLVMAGGVALNCVANGKLRAEGIFKDIWIQPAAGDSGGALGAALALYYGTFGGKRSISLPDGQKGSFLGPEYTDEEIRAVLDDKGAVYHELAREERNEEIAGLLDAQKVIGIFEGRMEYGPRALGHRSIIADPRSEKMQSRLNLSIKYRESFRPFAPAVLRERCADYFEHGWDSPYMLLCMDVKDRADEGFDLRGSIEADPDLTCIINRRRSCIPAVTHVDHSARVQTVDRQTDPGFYDLIKAFEKRTGCGVVINTSFNVRGEPIVCSPEDAYNCFMNTEMDVLVLQDFMLYKEEQPETEKRRDVYELD